MSPAVRRHTPLDADGTATLSRFARATDGLIDDAVRVLSSPIDAVAVCAAWHGIVGIGDRAPTTRISTWLDRRAGADAAALREKVSDPDDVHQRTGAPIHPSFPPARVASIARTRGDVKAKTRRWCAPVEELESRWAGRRRGPSASMASGSGLYDQRADGWDVELLNLIDIAPDTLSPVEREPFELQPSFAERWPVLAGIPWFAAIGDGAAAAASSVGLRPATGRAALTVGTSAAVRVVDDRDRAVGRRLPRSLFRYLVDDRRALVGAARSNAGNLVAWVGRALGMKTDDVVAAVASRVPASHGLHADPALAGERSPAWPLDASASVTGLDLCSAPADVAQAMVEAAVAGIGRTIDAVEDWSGPVDVVLSGGATTSPGWPQLLADATGRTIVCSSFPEASLRGAAVVALERLGCGAADAAPPGDRVVPDVARARAFERLRTA